MTCRRSATFTVVFAPVIVNTTLTSNTATVSSSTADPNPANNTATASAFPLAAIPAATPLTLALLAMTFVGIALLVLRR